MKRGIRWTEPIEVKCTACGAVALMPPQSEAQRVGGSEVLAPPGWFHGGVPEERGYFFERRVLACSAACRDVLSERQKMRDYPEYE